jgi:predicted MFS family arabinose efflux permease
MLAVISTTWVLPSLVGPGLAGVVAEHAGWRWVFFGVLPLVPLVAVLVLPRLRALGGPLGGVPGTSLPWWRQPGPRAAALTALLVCFGFFTAEAFLPLVLTEVEGFSFAAAGLPLSFSGIGWTTGAWVQARTAHTAWARTAAVGSALIAAGTLATATVMLDAIPAWVCYGTWLVSAFGMGLTYTIVQHVAIDTAAPGREASAGAAIELANLVGVAAGTWLAGIVVANTADHVDAGFASVYVVCGLVAAAGVLAARRLPSPTRQPRETEPQHAAATI